MTGKNSQPEVHEIDIFTKGGKVELIKLGDDTIELRPLPLDKIIDLIDIYRHTFPIASREVKNYLPDGYIPTGENDSVYLLAFKQASLGAIASKNVLNKLVDFLCDTLGKERGWVEKNVKPKGMFVVQNEIQEYVPGFEKKTIKKK